MTEDAEHAASDQDFVRCIRDALDLDTEWWTNEQATKGLIADFARSTDAEFVLKTALELGVVADLASRRDPEAQTRGAAQLQSKGFPTALARWAIDTWAAVLGLEAQTRPIGTTPRSAGAEMTVTVGTSEEAQFHDLRDAVASAPPGARLEVSRGKYRGPIVLSQPLTLLGVGAEPGDVIIETEESPCVVVHSDVTLEHLTLRARSSAPNGLFPCIRVRRGRLRLMRSDVSSWSSFPCVSVDGEWADCELLQCTIHDSYGAGISFDSRGIDSRVVDCDIFATERAGVVVERGRPLIESCRVYFVKGPGIVSASDAAPRIHDCEVFHTVGPGIQVSGRSEPRLRGCAIHHTENHGLLFTDGSGGSVDGCDVYENAASGIEIRDRSGPAVRSSRILGGRGRGVFVRSPARGRLTGCDVWLNELGDVVVERGAHPTIDTNRVGKLGFAEAMRNQDHSSRPWPDAGAPPRPAAWSVSLSRRFKPAALNPSVPLGQQAMWLRRNRRSTSAAGGDAEIDRQ